MYICLSCGTVLYEEEIVEREDYKKLCLDCYRQYQEDHFIYFYES